MDLKDFRYATLDDPRSQIRVLQLQPTTDDEAFCCRVDVYNLDQAPNYHAVSYTWDDRENQVIIIVDNTSVLVNRNCQEALLQAKHSGASYVWIDSVCINQGDLNEKSIQVSIMYDIFHAASQVLMCTGPAFEGVELVEQAAKEIVFQMIPVSYGEPDWESWAQTKGPDYMLALFGLQCTRSSFVLLSSVGGARDLCGSRISRGSLWTVTH
ncbi:Heterokaryon incompatibility protein 6, OR allele [Fulvia fulva]|uniref:Heterokaryon incompatibility protein 6, OR allele n=1 Tax=Passalora fulva TaxID=5499 RepID=A0A9Q8UWM4_PASFU|nr:Heterokaryon incompatibility protein 6, OR allele [Fulvia fulva]KAK4608935.1 Heterokaryon incompatibility protein 6, OR allele [Fulvia fulva]KAK4610008.1 Heterokaryon incompatibility protein 6, OR allele [Fulvia fulva]UJO25163.1 Heterokaryon incompatibility protein 6, OR allele [Fulvia fulva]WPV22622.1 Heterokaryon incompatibility protein 6, OR allele [Fulvia fulva]WPV37810.1 Heterokaryon incompatibility protein 6, OR allele [Fulvia fulva]